ncbi:MAG: UvrD-helicase domain-containing protein, partial [Eubacteriales bacterium]|nr:UvrD-helicase domain-containing protein [Eubacteriales bacterium]
MWKIIAAIFLIWVLVIGYKIYRKNKLENNPEVVAMLDKIQAFFNEIDVLTVDYFTKTLEENLRKDYRDVFEFFGKIPYSMIKNERISAFKSVYSNLISKVKVWNENYVEKTLLENEKIFDDIDGKSLDDQQRRAIVVDEINNLILAGAGSGKTLTISGKVKFLGDIKNIKPEEILLISFTNKAADEMSQRIAKKLHIDVEAKTFHKFGLGIMTKSYGKRFDIAEDYFLPNLIDQYFESHVSGDRKQIENLINFFGYYLNIPKDWEEFNSLGDCYDYYKNIDFETLKGKMQNNQVAVEGLSKMLKANKQTLQGETVKSLEEVMIANFLFLNGVNYIYEYKYPYESPDPYRKAYRPDFYLPDYDIYIEHFGITKNNKAPWLSEIEEQKYLEGMTWKREFHEENKTTLLETYSYYNKEGRLLLELERILKAANVEFKEVDYLEIYKQILDKKKDKYFSEFKKLISSFINLFKSNGYDVESFGKLSQQASKINNVFLCQRSLLFLSIVKPIFQRYQEELNKSEKIDFNDMINMATGLVREGKGDFKYKYIIIDEYQDISVSRFNLIKEV